MKINMFSAMLGKNPSSTKKGTGRYHVQGKRKHANTSMKSRCIPLEQSQFAYAKYEHHPNKAVSL